MLILYLADQTAIDHRPAGAVVAIDPPVLPRSARAMDVVADCARSPPLHGGAVGVGSGPPASRVKPSFVLFCFVHSPHAKEGCHVLT